MQIFKKNGNWIFWILTLIHLLAIYLGNDQIRFITKICLIPILIIYLVAQPEPISKLAYGALIASFLGDLLLTQAGVSYFLLGMLCFLCTHIFNSLYLIKIKNGQKQSDHLSILLAIPLIAIAIFICYFLMPYLGDLLVPISVYMFIICLMAIFAFLSAANKPIRAISLQYLIPGALFFIGSDAILALNKFIYQIPRLDVLVMLTYAFAQYSLVQGYRQIAIARSIRA